MAFENKTSEDYLRETVEVLKFVEDYTRRKTTDEFQYEQGHKLLSRIKRLSLEIEDHLVARELYGDG